MGYIYINLAYFNNFPMCFWVGQYFKPFEQYFKHSQGLVLPDLMMQKGSICELRVNNYVQGWIDIFIHCFTNLVDQNSL